MNYNEEAEQILLARIILNNELIPNLSVEESDFFDIEHKQIFRRINSCLQSEIPANALSLKDFFKTLSCGQEYLKTLLEASSFALTPSETLKILRELSRKRKIEEISHKAKEMASDASKNSQEIQESIMAMLEELNINSEKRTVSLKEAFVKFFNEQNNELLTSGYEELDKITGGFERGDLIILAGRPAMGKSVMGVNFALALARLGISCLIITLEMNQSQVARRILANLASVNVTKLKHKNLSEYDISALDQATTHAKDFPIYINDQGSITLPKIRYEIKKFAAKGVKFVMIDYIQLIKHQAKGGSVERVTEISNALKAMAMEFNVVILGLSQLSRAVEQREDKRPQLSDLRESGSIEQDANMVIFAFRPEYYLERQKPDDLGKLKEWEQTMQRLKGVAYAIVAKNRDGKCGEARLVFDGEFQRFSEINL